MDGSRFDAWTRRRLGLAIPGVAFSLAGLVGFDDIEAKKKRKNKKKKCEKLGQECNPNGKPPCCDCLDCGPGVDSIGKVCCRPGGAPCTVPNQGECCSGSCEGDFCFGVANGQPCFEDAHCLSYNCVNDECAPSG